MNIVDFNHSHLEEAAKIVLANYEEERQQVPILPKLNALLELTHFADNNLGVAAFEGNRMIGFLGAYYPINDAFGSTNVKGTYSPIHAHGAIGANRDRVYSKLYQEAAEKWVSEGIASHAIVLFAHDKVSLNSFFYNGFGLRCIDAIRPLEDILQIKAINPNHDSVCNYCEVPKEEWGKLLDHQNSLIAHLGTSPIFMKLPMMGEDEFYKRASADVRYFAAKQQEDYIAYIKVGDNGENFVTEDSSMLNICGAYCMPSFRGTGVTQNLLSHLMTTLKKEGYTRLGVDCESFNPNARGFWLKHFTEYTNSVVRRIDEKAIESAER